VDWPHRVAAITGASRGIGRALALEIARRGTAVALLATRQDLLREVAAEIERGGGRALPLRCDVRSREEVSGAIASAGRELGPVDLLIASAGIGRPVSALRFDAAEAEEMIRVNLLGLLYAVEAVLPGMLAAGRGRIVGISSLASFRGFADSSVYCASKAALNVQLEGLRVELAPRGIGVTTVLPGFVRTDMTARNAFRMPFLIGPEEAARKIVRAVERGRRVASFPWPAALFVWIAKRTPNAIFDRVVR
jgi:short-subunit dehydrogenase